MRQSRHSCDVSPLLAGSLVAGRSGRQREAGTSAGSRIGSWRVRSGHRCSRARHATGPRPSRHTEGTTSYPRSVLPSRSALKSLHRDHARNPRKSNGFGALIQHRAHRCSPSAGVRSARRKRFPLVGVRLVHVRHAPRDTEDTWTSQRQLPSATAAVQELHGLPVDAGQDDADRAEVRAGFESSLSPSSHCVREDHEPRQEVCTLCCLPTIGRPP